MAPVQDDTSEKNILYNLTVHAEWKLDTELFNRTQKDNKELTLWKKVTLTSYRGIWNFLRNIGLRLPFTSGPQWDLPAGFVHIVNCQLGWNIAVGRCGQLVAILQDQLVEIRSARDDYSSTFSRAAVLPDHYPQWRQMAWSTDGAMLAVTHSSGTVQVFDTIGTHLFDIPTVDDGNSSMNSNIPSNLTKSIAGLLFLENDSIKEGTSHLLVITFSGELFKYLVNRNGEYELLHVFNFTSHHLQGVTSVLYLPVHSLLIIGSHIPAAAGLDDTMLDAEQNGLSLWRILSSSPYYKLVTDYEGDLQKSKQKSFLKRLMILPKLSYQTSKDSIFKMSLSPNQKQLATLHYSGKLILWDVPSLHKRKSWTHEQQPCHDELNPEFLEKPQKRKLLKDLVHSKNLLDINWWSDDALILARCQGSVSLASTKSLKNMLGETPEWFEPAPRVTDTFDGRFLGLECACKFVNKNSLVNTSSNSSLSDEDQFEDSDDEDMSWMRKTTQYTRHILYYITDNECFKPMLKKPKGK